jgi:hypothetical protein
MKYYTKILLIVLLLCNAFSCSRKPTDFRAFLNGSEKTYPGAVNAVAISPGNLRVRLSWHPSPDPSVARYVVYWNNYADSLVIPASKHNPADTVGCLIGNLQEYNYTFFINSYDNAGNKSITTELDNVRIYGSIYQNYLHNRPANQDTPFVISSNNSDVTINFRRPDSVNITTVIKYTDNTGAQQTQISPDSSSILLPNFKFGTSVLYRSSYIPVRSAIDTFLTSGYDTFPSIFRIVQCDKSLFREIHLPNDMSAGFGTSMSQLWDGATQPKGFPDIFHSDGSAPFPQHFSFEVWGIADTTGAETMLPGNDPGWKNEAVTKGWTLLKEVVRTDDGQAPFNADLIPNPPPVRYIMVRILKTTDDPSYVNLSQLTFWFKQ